jgi:hypothetical protein
MVNSITAEPIQTLDADAALDWLRRVGRNETTITDLAKGWGWERTRASRALNRWENAGQITRAPGSRGKIIISAACTEVAPVLSAPTTTVQAVARPVARRALASTLPATVLFLVALGLGGIGLVTNARFAASFGQSDEAAAILAMIGVAVDALSMALPAAACQLWACGARLTAVMTWCVWPFVVGVSILAGVGFAATNIGDAVGNRARGVAEATALRATVGRLRTERANITEVRSVGGLEAQLERDRPLINREIWVATRGCHDVTLRESATVCAAIMATRQAVSTAARRDDIDAELRVAESKLATAPAISSNDPQAEAAAEIASWITAGRIRLQPRDIALLRVISMALPPTLAGVMLMLAARLWNADRRTP